MTNSSTQFINDINLYYPIVGKNIDSQGFRTNFKNIKQGLKWLDLDISSINTNRMVLSKYVNNFNNNTIRKFQLLEYSELVNDESNVTQTGGIVVDYRKGNYQKFTVGAGTTIITIENFTETNAGQIVVSITKNSVSASYIEFDSTMTPLEGIKFPLLLENDDPYIFKITNEKNNFYIQLVNNIQKILYFPYDLENYTTLNDVPQGSTGSVLFLEGNTNGILYNTGTNWYQASGSKITFVDLSVVKNTSIIRISKNTAITPFTPVSASSDYIPISYSISPDLPTGVLLNENTGVVSGTPTITQSLTPYEITIKDATNDQQTINIDLISSNEFVVTQLLTSLQFTSGQSNSFTPLYVSGGYSPYVYTISPSFSGSAVGLSINPTSGAISGTANGTQNATNYTITVTDDEGTVINKSISISILTP